MPASLKLDTPTASQYHCDAGQQANTLGMAIVVSSEQILGTEERAEPPA